MYPSLDGRGVGRRMDVYMYGWVPSLFMWNSHNVVSQLYPNTKCFWIKKLKLNKNKQKTWNSLIFSTVLIFWRVCMSGRILWVSEGSRVSWSHAKGNKAWSLGNMSARHIDIFDLSEICLYFTRFSPSMDGESQGNWLPEQRVAQRQSI